MSAFRNGPAAGATLVFRRCPPWLRVVEDTSGGFDVLDQLGDEPTEEETVHVYRRTGDVAVAHINGRGTKTRSGFYEFADYEHVPVDDETRERLRDTTTWRAWADAQ